MKKYICTVCSYIYDPAVGDPDGGIAPGTAFEDIPEDWVCPLCGVGKEDFESQDSPLFLLVCPFGKEVISLVIHDDECGEVFYPYFPDCFHSQFFKGNDFY